MADLDVRPSQPRRSSPRPRRPPPPAPSCARQIAGLERRLSDTLIACLPYGDAAASAPALPARRDAAARPARGPRVLDLGELERARDELAARLSAARAELHRRGERDGPGPRPPRARCASSPAATASSASRAPSSGEGRCGVWQVRPRLGLLGMLMGWWEVKLSSGCP